MSFIKYPFTESVLQQLSSGSSGSWIIFRASVFSFPGKRLHRYAAFNCPGGAVTGEKICVLFIDWEAQFSCTIAHCEKLRALYADVIETFYWSPCRSPPKMP